MNGSAEKVHNHTEFSTLVHLIVRSLGRGGHHVPKPITPLYQEAFAVLASLKRDASEDTIRIMSTIVRAELPLASLVHILVIGEEVHIADFEEILCLALHDFDETPGEAKFESMDEALLYMSDAIVRGAITPALTPYWTALLTRKPVQKRILTRLHSEGEFSVSWAIMFYNVAEWLRSCGSQECLSLLDGMVSQIKMSVFLDDASTDDVINATLRLATLVAKQPNPQNPIDRPLILKILPLFCRELERTSDFDLPATCLRLLRTSHFSETLADLMQSASSLDYSTLLYLARTLKVASLRLNSNPFDTLFALLHQLPWTSVISAHLAPTHEGVQLEVMESLAAGRILFRTTSDQDHAVSVLPRELSQQEAEIALPLVARILSTSHDQVQASLCIKFFAFVGFKAVFQTAFATNCATDMVFNAASRIWAWCYAPSHAGSPWQAEGAKLISEKLPLDQQIRYIMSIADNTPESARLFPLLRLLALRINGHRKEKAISTVMPILLSCACKFIGCSWVASEDDIVDIVRNEDVLAGAFRVLSLRNNQATAEVRVGSLAI
ncbi:hypothetical protein CALCODRAFT_93792 [Calocera cornea HHB12733]|uniref:Uncharacterized protein n=1 Tax=Calocera cornea HHB12733 TaxID=1353952 RepID=A0A165D8P1_9BASI|nr:hypothetical protein CALCODRAFT_93792 [Calocera cornea HHB12733]